MKTITCQAEETCIKTALEETRRITGETCELKIEPGVCCLRAPIVLNEKDAGLTISGPEDGSCVISGELILEKWTKLEGTPFYTASVPEGAEPRILVASNEVKDRSAFRPCARFPETGSLKNLDHPKIGWMGSMNAGWNRPPTQYELTHMTVNPQDIPAIDENNADITIFHSWDESTVRIQSLDRETGIMTFRSRTDHPAGAWRNDYIFRNIIEGMTTPGQWMFDRTNSRVIYYPYPDETPVPPFRIPVPMALIRIEKGADRVTLRNLTFELANAPGGTPGLRAVNPTGAVDAADVSNLTLEKLNFSFCAGQGIRTFRCPDVRIENCRVRDCGACGILTLESMPSEIRGNTVLNIGKIHNSSVAITAGGKSERMFVQGGRIPEHGKAIVENNRIDGSPYCGIVCCGDGHTISGNRISHVMEVLHDGAAIYVSRGRNCLVTENKIHDIVLPANCAAHGIYFDERSLDSVAENNIVLNCSSPAQMHRAHNTTWRNNVFVSNTNIRIRNMVSDGSLFENNTIISQKEIEFVTYPEHIIRRNNTIFSATDSVRDIESDYHFGFRFFMKNNELAFRVISPVSERAETWKRIVIFGDSITHAGGFVRTLQLYLSCRYPEREIQVFNAGVCGDSTSGALNRIERDVFALKPDAVFLAFGMNDVGRDLYGDLRPDPETARLRAEKYDLFFKNMDSLVKRICEYGADPVILTPFAYDEYDAENDTREKYGFCNSAGLSGFADKLHAPFSSSVPIVELHMTSSRLYAAHPELQIAPDRVHPDERGHAVAAAEIVKTLWPEAPATPGLPFPEDDAVKAIDPFVSMEPLRNTGADSAKSSVDTRPLLSALKALGEAEWPLGELAKFDSMLEARNISPDDLPAADAALRAITEEQTVYRPYYEEHTRLYRDVYRPERKELIAKAETARRDYFEQLKRIAGK